MTISAPPELQSPQARKAKHPVLIAHHETRYKDMQLRIADVITQFAGSMTFVYIHAVLFAS